MRVSVVIPARNAALHIRECLQGLHQQDFRNAEFIVVDDASSDETPEIVGEFIKKDPRFLLVERTIQGGAAMARKDGALLAKGRYLHFVDADDFVVRGLYSRVIPLLETTACAAGVFRYTKFSDTSEFSERVMVPSGRHRNPRKINRQDLGEHLFLLTHPSLWDKIWERELFMDEIPHFTPSASWAEDDLPHTYSALARARKTLHFPEVFYGYRQSVVGSKMSSAGKDPDAVLRALELLRSRLHASGELESLSSGHNSFIMVQVHQTLSMLDGENQKQFFYRAQSMVQELVVQQADRLPIPFLTPRSARYYYFLQSKNFSQFAETFQKGHLNPYPRKFSPEKLRTLALVPWSYR